MAYSLDQFLAVRRTTAVAPSPDGRWVAAASDTTGQFNAWLHPSRGGYPLQRTAWLDRSVRHVAWSPDASTLYLAADADGSEFYQVFEMPAAGGVPRRLTARDDVQYHLMGRPVSPDGRFLAYAGNEHKPTDVDVFVRDLRSGETRRLEQPPAFYVHAAWSPDGRRLALVDFRMNTDSDAVVIDRDGRGRRVLAPHAARERQFPFAWRGPWIYLVSDRGRDFLGVARVREDGSKWEWIVAPDWDVEQADLSEDGRTMLYVVNEEGASRAYVRREARARRLRLPDGVVTEAALDPRGRFAAFLHATARRPVDVYVADLRAGRVDRITDNALGGIDEAGLVEPSRVRYPTFDGSKIPAWVYRPRGVRGRAPVLFSIHGGPNAQERPSYNYSGLYQYLLTRGTAVFAPNIRGSTGYGKTYSELIHRDFGGNDVKDVEAAVAWLRRQSWVDASRIALFGGSYGGFMVLSAATRLPDLWCAGVDVVGPSNLVTFARAVPPTWKRFVKEWVGDPDEDRAMLEKRSPVRYVDNVRVPLLILQGARDPRVVKGESDQMVERLKARGCDVEYHVYEDEGHGFTRVANQRDAFTKIARFLEERLAARAEVGA